MSAFISHISCSPIFICTDYLFEVPPDKSPSLTLFPEHPAATTTLVCWKPSCQQLLDCVNLAVWCCWVRKATCWSLYTYGYIMWSGEAQRNENTLRQQALRVYTQISQTKGVLGEMFLLWTRPSPRRLQPSVSSSERERRHAHCSHRYPLSACHLSSRPFTCTVSVLWGNILDVLIYLLCKMVTKAWEHRRESAQ